MSLRKFGTGKILTEPKDDKIVAEANWHPSDVKALEAENDDDKD
jgi:hypothetical protein